MKAHILFAFLFLIMCFSMCSTHSGSQNGSADSLNISKKNLANAAQGDSIENIFLGDWSNDSNESFLLNHLRISHGSSMFHVCPQLGIKLRNVYHKDTLLLYIVESYIDVYQPPEFSLPKTNSLFAKCFIIDSCIKVHYAREVFSKNVQTLALDTDFCYQFPHEDTLTGKNEGIDDHYEIVLAGYHARYKMAFEINAKNGHDIWNNFIGVWCNIVDSERDMYSMDCIDIKNDTSVFVDIGDQLTVMCKNVYHSDTLYLYVIDTDPAGWCFTPSFHTPKPKSLFAKCYIVDSAIKIYYAQKLFRNNIWKYNIYTGFSFKRSIIR